MKLLETIQNELQCSEEEAKIALDTVYQNSKLLQRALILALKNEFDK